LEHAIVRVRKDDRLLGENGDRIIVRVRKDVRLLRERGNGYSEGT